MKQFQMKMYAFSEQMIHLIKTGPDVADINLQRALVWGRVGLNFYTNEFGIKQTFLFQ